MKEVAMSMNDAIGRGMKFEINVTPLIDVLLVLLIIFMVIVPALPRGEATQVPRNPAGHPEPGVAVVLEVLKDPAGGVSFRINQQAVRRGDLPARLAGIYANRAERVLFVKGDDQLKFTEIAEVIDISHRAGVDRVGLLTPKLAAGL
jgi:biopolymer transport protein TolR